MRAISDAKTKWEFLGLELGITSEDLESIKKNNNSEIEHCFKDMLKEWLKMVDPSPSWEGLIQALRSPFVGCRHLAKKIAEEHKSIFFSTV